VFSIFLATLCDDSFSDVPTVEIVNASWFQEDVRLSEESFAFIFLYISPPPHSQKRPPYGRGHIPLLLFSDGIVLLLAQDKTTVVSEG
jgi:hypothetical protein